jgi:uncharacterized repeat protein (TIGR01451 family)
MGPKGRRVCQALVLALCAGWLSGCFGVTANPSYFPYLCLPGDIIETHAKPPGPGYFANFDKYSVRLEVRPLDAANPVHTQHVLIATVLDCQGNPLRSRRVEWLLEGVGNIIEVDESGFFPGRGYKVDGKYAVSYTDYCEHTITRGNKDPNDDFTIRPGQTWCVVSSAMEGDSHITCYAPGIYEWDKGRVFVSCKWIDANWIFPAGVIVPAGTPQVLTTRIVRHTDKQPLANYRVRYTILDDDPAAVFAHTRTKEAVAVSDLNGNASVTLTEVTPRPGLTHVAMEVIRPPDPTAPSGVGVSLARGDVAVEWLAPAINLSVTGPPTGSRDAQVTYTTTIGNTGKVESRGMLVTQPIPDGLQYVSSQPLAFLDKQQLVWTLKNLAPGQNHAVNAVYKAVRAGTTTCCSTVVTDEGLRDTQCAKTEIGEPRLSVSLAGPPTAQLNAPFKYQITVTNESTSTVTGVNVEATFDKSFKHESQASTVRLDLGTLQPKEVRPMPALSLTPTAVGHFTTRVSAKADGGLFDVAEQTVTVQQAQLSVKLIGPARKYVGWDADWQLRVTNDGDVAVNNVQVKNVLPPELSAKTWSDNGKPAPGEVMWDIGELKPHEQKTLTIKTRCDKLAKGAINRVVATTPGGVTASDEVGVDIFGLPGLHVEIKEAENPVFVGKTVKYVIAVNNTGTTPATELDIKATLPKELKLVPGGTKGPTQANVTDQVITFGRLESLAAQQTIEYQVEAQALAVGDVRFTVEMRSASLANPAPVTVQEATRIIDAGPGPP